MPRPDRGLGIAGPLGLGLVGAIPLCPIVQLDMPSLHALSNVLAGQNGLGWCLRVLRWAAGGRCGGAMRFLARLW